MSTTSIDILKRISEKFSLSYVEQDWGIENARNVSVSNAFLILDTHLGQDANVNQQIIELLFEVVNEALMQGCLNQEETKRFQMLVKSNEFKTSHSDMLNYWRKMDWREFPVVGLLSSHADSDL